MTDRQVTSKKRVSDQRLDELLDFFEYRYTGRENATGLDTFALLAELQQRRSNETGDGDCICKGNWRLIVKETETLLDKRFRDSRGREWTFFGIVHSSDDYYYGMSSKDGENCNLVLLSCVGSLEGHEFTEIPSKETGSERG